MKYFTYNSIYLDQLYCLPIQLLAYAIFHLQFNIFRSIILFTYEIVYLYRKFLSETQWPVLFGRGHSQDVVFLQCETS